MIDHKRVERARNVDMISFLERHEGLSFTQQNGTYRCKEHPSLAVKSDRHAWYWHSKGVGGFGPLDFLLKIEGMPFRSAFEAVDAAEATMANAPSIALTPDSENSCSRKSLILPPKTGTPLHLYDYLCAKRGIDASIVNWLIQKEMLYEDKRGNVVFVGHDMQGNPRFACVRGMHGDFRGDCAGSDKRYGFHMIADAHSNVLYIFESPIDCMSHASLTNVDRCDSRSWEQQGRLSLAGTSDAALAFFLNQHSAVKRLVFCLDNDATGRKAANFLARKYVDRGYATQIELPHRKDYNEDLQAHMKLSRIQKMRPTGKER